ncbi:MAG TPA: hypothetical protein PLP19_22175 [bacterium]|nr:hypothetical protein [bacterium]HPN46208.1 hypothetical protein [bacterium]
MVEKLIELLAPIIGLALKQVLTPLLTGMMTREPEHGAVALAAMYPVIDAELEPLTGKTATALDDCAVATLKSVIEDVAEKFGVALANVDGD